MHDNSIGVIISANDFNTRERERTIKVQALIYRGEHHYTTTKECIGLLHNQGMTGV